LRLKRCSFIEAVGNRDFSDCTSIDGAKFRDFLLGKGASCKLDQAYFFVLRANHKVNNPRTWIECYKPLSWNLHAFRW
jgi:hypothetical protein